uniref:C-factor-like n=1 Tax=Acanthochromis polyacanthus TaxID=80966 RepID=A0A3Q1G542_9TELE
MAAVDTTGNILVTGANRGIGLELIKQLAVKMGGEAHIYACCREPEGPGAEALREVATKCPGKITIIKLDVADEDSMSTAARTVSEKIAAGGLNLLINNAAINKPASPAPLSATTKKDMMDVYETNVVGPHDANILVSLCVPGNKMSCRRAAIINLSTMVSSIEKCPETFSTAQMYPYRTSKAALNMLTRCQALDFKNHNILVAAIHPGWVLTRSLSSRAPLGCGGTGDFHHGCAADKSAATV